MRKVLSLLMSIIMLVSCVGSIQLSACAADYTTMATDLPLNGQWSGDYWITETNREQWFRVTIPSDGKYSFKTMSYKDRTGIIFYNYDLSKEIIGDWYRYTNGTEVSPVTRTYNCVLSAGTYYIKTGGDKGKYMLSWYELSPENCSHEFENKTVSSTYTTQGYTLHTCKICGYSYTDNYTAKLKVNVPAVSSLKKGKKKITVYISNAYNIDGIQISYSTSKKFTKSKTKTLSTKKTAKTLSKLKNKKKYYVKVRGYKIVNGKKVYSSWSKVKSVKTK